jgi:hypothetical protein
MDTALTIMHVILAAPYGVVITVSNLTTVSTSGDEKQFLFPFCK